MCLRRFFNPFIFFVVHSDADMYDSYLKDAWKVSTLHGKAQKTDLRAVQLYEKKEPKIPQDQTLKFSRKKSVKSSMKCTRRCGGQRPCIATPQRLSLGRWVSAAPRRVGGLRSSTTSVGWIRGISRAVRSVSRHHTTGGNVAHGR